MLVKYEQTSDQLAGIFDKGHIHHDAMEFIFDFVANQTTSSNDVRSFFFW